MRWIKFKFRERPIVPNRLLLVTESEQIMFKVRGGYQFIFIYILLLIK